MGIREKSRIKLKSLKHEDGWRWKHVGGLEGVGVHGTWRRLYESPRWADQAFGFFVLREVRLQSETLSASGAFVRFRAWKVGHLGAADRREPFLPECVCTWALRLLLSAKCFEQMSHLNGFSPAENGNIWKVRDHELTVCSQMSLEQPLTTELLAAHVALTGLKTPCSVFNVISSLTTGDVFQSFASLLFLSGDDGVL